MLRPVSADVRSVDDVTTFGRYYDFHIGGDSTDTNGDWELLNNAKLALKAIGSPIRGVVFEENGGLHGINRALGHGSRLNREHCIGDFLRIDTSVVATYTECQKSALSVAIVT